MRRTILALSLLTAGALLPAGAAEPVALAFSTTESVSVSGTAYAPQGPGAAQRWDGYFTVQVTYSGTYDGQGLTPVAEARAYARWTVCTITFSTCTTVDYGQGQIVAQTAIVADPVANTVRVRFQDQALRLIDVTLARPSYSFGVNGGVPNAWLDPRTNTVHADNGFTGIGRSGYEVTGTIDGFPITTTPPSCSSYCNFFMGTSYNRWITAGVTLND